MKKRFILFIIFIAGLATLIVASAVVADHYVKAHLANNLVKEYSSEEQAIGNQVSISVSDRFKGIQNVLTSIALDPRVINSDPNVCNPALKEYYNSMNVGVGNLGRVNLAGNFYCTLNPKLLNKPANSLGTYINELFEDPAHKPVVSHELKVPGVEGYVVALHVPVYDSDHKFAGTIGGAVYLNELSKSLFDKLKFAQTGFAAVQDDNGDIIYAHNKKNIGKNYFSQSIQGQPGANLGDLNKAILAARKGKPSRCRMWPLEV